MSKKYPINRFPTSQYAFRLKRFGWCFFCGEFWSGVFWQWLIFLGECSGNWCTALGTVRCRHGRCGEDKKTQCLSLVSHWICGRPLGFDPDFCFSSWRRREFRQGGVITIGLTTGVLETLPLLCQIYHCVSSGLSVLRTGHTGYFPREESRRNRVTLRLPPRLHTQGRSMKVRRGVLRCGGYRVWPERDDL